MKVWTDKAGNELEMKEFLTRFKDGVAKTTPLQHIRLQMWSMIPIFVGITWGIIFTFIMKVYWLTLILCGALPLNLVSYVGMWQKYTSYKKVEEIMKGGDKNG